MHAESIITRVVWILIGIVGILLVITILVATLAYNYDFFSIVPIILVLLVSAIPVALPATFAIAMALGSLEIAKKNVLITRLSCTQDIASMTVLCSDKTGTLSMAQLSIVNILIVDPEKFTEHDLIIYGCLASVEQNKDPIDLAFFDKAKQQELSETISSKNYKQINFVPFSTETRRTSATIQDLNNNNSLIYVTKGAVPEVMALCNVGPSDPAHQQIEAKVEEYGQMGEKSLAIAVSFVGENSGFQLVGIASLQDPPRPDSKETVRKLKEDLGINVKMLTGDALPIAKQMAKELGIGSRMYSLKRLKEETKESGTTLSLDMSKIDGLAEVLPEDKHFVVTQLQKLHAIVGSNKKKKGPSFYFLPIHNFQK